MLYSYIGKRGKEPGLGVRLFSGLVEKFLPLPIPNPPHGTPPSPAARSAYRMSNLAFQQRKQTARVIVGREVVSVIISAIFRVACEKQSLF